MKKVDKSLLVAMEFESIVSASTGKRDGVNNKLYAIEGAPGVFRRVARTTTGITKPEKNLLAQFDGSIIELVYAKDVVDEILEAVSTQGEEETPTDPTDPTKDVGINPSAGVDTGSFRSESQNGAAGSSGVEILGQPRVESEGQACQNPSSPKSEPAGYHETPTEPPTSYPDRKRRSAPLSP